MSPVIPGKPDLVMGGAPVDSNHGVPFKKKDEDDDKKDKDDDSKHEKGESKDEEKKEHEGKSEKEEDKADKDEEKGEHKNPFADKKASLRQPGPYMERKQAEGPLRPTDGYMARQPGDYMKKRD